MKTKYFLIAIGSLLAAASVWAGRTAWRVHRQLVTLEVRNAPLAYVLRQIEKQTWKKIRAEQSLDARITLRVKEKPLAEVLNRIAQQAGARWATVFAVYGSSTGLSALESALRGDGKLEPAGWTKIAPNAADFREGGAGRPADHMRLNLRADDPNAPDPASRPRIITEDTGPSLDHLPEPPPDGVEPNARQERRVLARRTKDGQVMFFGGASGEMEMWSPEELLLESALSSRLGTDSHPAPTAPAAAEAARKVNGHWTSFLAFRKSSLGVGFGGLPSDRPGLEPGVKDPNARFATLSPQQRVQRARERLQWKQK